MPVRFYNTLTRKVEEFKPIQPGVATLYTCGPTVYNFPHIGNLRTFSFEDLLHRWLEYRGYKVRQVMNLTDVDDKTIRDSKKNNLSLKEFTDIYKKHFFDDINALNIKPAEKYPAATEHIPEMVDMISMLIEKGFAYTSSDGVYFKVSAFRDYGRLANLEHDSLQAGASGRLSSDEYSKENIADFALWKKWTPEDGDVKWPAPFGDGRPGWHIECSVMSMKYLGETIDLHAGGVDLVFPHHTNEIAQSEAATGKPFVNYWLHATHLIVDGEKMSKSKGNFYTLRDLLDKGYSARSIRYALLTTHYRKPLNFTFDLIKQADSSLKRIDEFIFALGQIKNTGEMNKAVHGQLMMSAEKFESSLDDDLNISEAMAAVFDLISVFYEKGGGSTVANAEEIFAFLGRIDSVLGFVSIAKKDSLTDEENKLIEERSSAKLSKDFKRADEIRGELLNRGIEIRDTKDGTVWKRL